MKKLARILAEEGLIKKTAADKAAGKNGYIAFYRGKRMEVMADTSYEAQQIAAKKFKAKKSYDVTVVLAEMDGKQVTHRPLMASTMYDLDGEVLSKREMLDRAIAKEMTFIGYSKPVLKFHAIMGDNSDDSAAVFQIGKRDFDKLRVPDRTSQKTREKVKRQLLDKLVKKHLHQIRDRIDYNTWMKKTNPSVDEQITWIKSRY